MDFKEFYFRCDDFDNMMTFVDSIWSRVFNVSYDDGKDKDHTTKVGWTVRVKVYEVK